MAQKCGEELKIGRCTSQEGQNYKNAEQRGLFCGFGLGHMYCVDLCVCLCAHITAFFSVSGQKN